MAAATGLYSLAQGHVEEGETDVWEADDPGAAPGILALQAGLAVRDHFPDVFLDVHRELFSAYSTAQRIRRRPEPASIVSSN